MRYLQLDNDALASHDGDVLVPSRRVQQALVASFLHRARTGDTPTLALPRVLTPDDLFAELYDALLIRGGIAPRRRLTPIAQRALIEASLSPELRMLAGLFESGWQLVHDYELVAELEQFDDYEDARRFRAWSLEYRRELDRRQLVTPPELARIVARSLERGNGVPPRRLAYVGFDHTTPALQRFFDTLTIRDEAPIRVALANESPKGHFLFVAGDPQSELCRAFRWAHERIVATDGAARIGVVVPDLADRYDAVLRQLEAVFGTADASAPFNVSSGIPLASVPLVADALLFLQWCTDAQRSDDVARLMGSPFFRFGRGDRIPRGARLASAYSFPTFARVTGRRDVVELARELASWRSSRSFSDWMHEFGRLLRRAGWPGTSRMSSETFQAKGRWDELIAELVTKTLPLAPCTAAEALATLVSAAGTRTFAPERPSAPLQVLGYLESAGLRFTDLWVTGLDADAWPALSRPHPFVPRRWQALRSVARLTPQDEVAFCLRMQDRWLAAAPNVVFSYAATSRTGEQLRVSPLLPVGVPLPGDSIVVSDPPPSRLVPTDDILARSDALRTTLTAVALRDQSLCPFRAFAIHRLGIAPRSPPSLLPTPDERGSTVHDALLRLYGSIASRAELVALSADARTSLATDAARAAVRGSSQRTAAQRYLANEEDRLRRLLLDWLDVDAARPDFRVEAIEHDLALELGGATMRVRLDRVDRDLATGKRIVLDYKTGSAAIGRWRGDRPEDPQLPLYAVVAGDVDGVFFAELGATDSRLTGAVAATDRYLRSPRIRIVGPDAVGAGSWDELLAAWRAIVTSLAAEYLGGDARVEPLHARVCKSCHLHTLCRVGDRRSQRADG